MGFEPIQNGILAGLWLSILVGPLVVVIVQNTLSKGIAHGFYTIAGIWLSDLLYILASYTLVSQISTLVQSTFFIESIGLFGGIVVLIIGVGMTFNKPKNLDFNAVQTNTKMDAAKSFVQGFSVNTFNPFTITFWTGAVSSSIAHEGWELADQVAFLVTILVVIMITDSCKVYFANHIRKYISSAMIYKINKGAGVVIIICGIYLIGKYLNL